MPRATRLTDLQLILLSHAARRDNGQLHPLPPAAKDDPERTERDLQSLLHRELVAEAPASNKAATWRIADEVRIGLVLTDKGRAVIGVEDSAEADVPDAEPFSGPKHLIESSRISSSAAMSLNGLLWDFPAALAHSCQRQLST